MENYRPDQSGSLYQLNKYSEKRIESIVIKSRIKAFGEKFESYLYAFAENYLGLKSPNVETYVRFYSRILKELENGNILLAKQLLSRISHERITRKDKNTLMRYIWKFEESLDKEFGKS